MEFADTDTSPYIDAQEFARERNARGENPIETIKELRGRYGLELQPARSLVVTPEEIEKFLSSERASGISRLEARLSVKRRFGCGGKEALSYIDASGLWSSDDKTPRD
ncbi:hypothetical protein CN311_21275 [Mesorhizobium sanjuanii]|uniref:Uncharacterized protein n=1 Tax=Mesorhizobium sanjuanii TaxID=2037900 RepID=A0A2A6FBL0_9HYPH|nr:hypothetical protein [Mesorhizobium sanjuanii]PDQ19105.1 hypothetical protein CN311_21275 [Mesorhizobium sanjuanii]